MFKDIDKNTNWHSFCLGMKWYRVYSEITEHLTINIILHYNIIVLVLMTERFAVSREACEGEQTCTLTRLNTVSCSTFSPWYPLTYQQTRPNSKQDKVIKHKLIMRRVNNALPFMHKERNIAWKIYWPSRLLFLSVGYEYMGTYLVSGCIRLIFTIKEECGH